MNEEDDEVEESRRSLPLKQIKLTCRKDRIHNRLQAKKNEELFRRESDDI